MITEYKVPAHADEPAAEEEKSPVAASSHASSFTPIHRPEAPPATKKSYTLIVIVTIVLFIVGIVIAVQANKPAPVTHATKTSSSSGSSTEGGNTQAQTDNNDVVDPTTDSSGQTKDEGNFCDNPVNALTEC